MTEPTYSCARCGAAAVVQAGGTQIVRSCGCGDDAPVTAGMAAVAKGAGGLRVG